MKARKRFIKVRDWGLNEKKDGFGNPITRKHVLGAFIIGMIPLLNIFFLILVLLNYDVYYEEVQKR